MGPCSRCWPRLVAPSLLALFLPGAATGADVLIANGLAPPNPANVLDDATHAADTVIVRNDGCALPPSSCTSPTPTAVQLASGADVDELEMRDTSIAEILAGATLSHLSIPSGNPSITISGGTLTDTPTSVSGLIGDLAMTGGTVLGGMSKGGSTELTGGSVASLTVGSNGLATATIDGASVTGEVDLDPTSSLVFSSGSIGSLSTGGSTSVLMSGGTITGVATLLDADATFSGGSIQGNLNLLSADVTLSGTHLEGPLLFVSDGEVVMSDGAVDGDVSIGNGGTLVWRGGTWAGTAKAHDTSVITIVGEDFAVDGSPVPFGPLAAQTGTLTGSVDGSPITVPFVQGGGSDGMSTYDGTIRLASPVPGPGPGLVWLAALLVGGCGWSTLRRTPGSEG